MKSKYPYYRCITVLITIVILCSTVLVVVVVVKIVLVIVLSINKSTFLISINYCTRIIMSSSAAAKPAMSESSQKRKSAEIDLSSDSTNNANDYDDNLSNKQPRLIVEGNSKNTDTNATAADHISIDEAPIVFFEPRGLSDFTITFQQVQFKVHKVTLCQHAAYFHQLLINDQTKLAYDRNESGITLPDSFGEGNCTADLFTLFLQLLYESSPSAALTQQLLLGQNVRGVLGIANYLSAPKVCQRCCDCLVQQYESIKSVKDQLAQTWSLLHLAQKYQHPQLQKVCVWSIVYSDLVPQKQPEYAKYAPLLNGTAWCAIMEQYSTRYSFRCEKFRYCSATKCQTMVEGKCLWYCPRCKGTEFLKEI
jgi:hypothetical protein